MEEKSFLFGINYWPRERAMYWWRDFEKTDLNYDFSRLHIAGIEIIRVFLLWEDFQPHPNKILPVMIDHLVKVLEGAWENGLKVIITLFCGHMNGINWLPPWMVTTKPSKGLFPTYCCNRVRNLRPRNPFGDTEVITAQASFCKEIAHVLKDHPSLHSWNLGNETSKWAQPERHEDLDVWLRVMKETFKEIDESVPVTCSIGLKDLEEKSGFDPAFLPHHLDFLSLNLQPVYSSNISNLDDPCFIQYMAKLTGWLTGGAEIFIDGFGIPTVPVKEDRAVIEKIQSASYIPLYPETRGAEYHEKALTGLMNCGVPGALPWCFGDYQKILWEVPPFHTAIHECFFGLWRADGSEKEAVAILRNVKKSCSTRKTEMDTSWIDIDNEEYWNAPAFHLNRLFQRYREC